jgi:RNA polymerase sigma-70 factor (ECF subfamily)
MGGQNAAFQTTQWTQIVQARTDSNTRRREILGRVLGRYWKPVYCYLCRRGHDPEEAKDLTQGFFHEIVLGRGLVQRADRAKGRFRTFLLTALCRYVTSCRRAKGARKRMPEGGFLRLDGWESFGLPEPVQAATPEQAFDHAWASALLDRVLADVERECVAAGKAAHWAVFSARVLGPILRDAEPPSLSVLCAEYRISSESQASNMIITAKRRFRACLERHILEIVGSEAEVDAEIRDLIEMLSFGGARK